MVMGFTQTNAIQVKQIKGKGRGVSPPFIYVAK